MGFNLKMYYLMMRFVLKIKRLGAHLLIPEHLPPGSAVLFKYNRRVISHLCQLCGNLSQNWSLKFKSRVNLNPVMKQYESDPKYIVHSNPHDHKKKCFSSARIIKSK